MTERQKQLARHCLGFDGRRKMSYRNHFVAGPGHADYDEWMAMVAAGEAHRGAGSPISGGDDVFWLTREAALSVREKDEHLGRDFRE